MDRGPMASINYQKEKATSFCS